MGSAARIPVRASKMRVSALSTKSAIHRTIRGDWELSWEKAKHEKELFKLGVRPGKGVLTTHKGVHRAISSVITQRFPGAIYSQEPFDPRTTVCFDSQRLPYCMSSVDNSREYIYNWNIDIVHYFWPRLKLSIDWTLVNTGHEYKDLQPIWSPIYTRARWVDWKLARPRTMRQASKTVTKTAADVLRQKERVRYQVFRVTCLRAMDR